MTTGTTVVPNDADDSILLPMKTRHLQDALKVIVYYDLQMNRKCCRLKSGQGLCGELN